MYLSLFSLTTYFSSFSAFWPSPLSQSHTDPLTYLAPSTTPKSVTQGLTSMNSPTASLCSHRSESMTAFSHMLKRTVSYKFMNTAFIYWCPWSGSSTWSFSSIVWVTSCLRPMTMRLIFFSIVWRFSMIFLAFTSFRRKGFLKTLLSAIDLMPFQYSFCSRMCSSYPYYMTCLHFSPSPHRECNFSKYR